MFDVWITSFLSSRTPKTVIKNLSFINKRAENILMFNQEHLTATNLLPEVIFGVGSHKTQINKYILFPENRQIGLQNKSSNFSEINK